MTFACAACRRVRSQCGHKLGWRRHGPILGFDQNRSSYAGRIGIALAAAALGPGPIAAAFCDFAFLCLWSRAVHLCDRGPYAELARHRGQGGPGAGQPALLRRPLVRIPDHRPVLFSVDPMDRACPPSTVYAAVNHYAGDNRWWSGSEVDGH